MSRVLIYIIICIKYIKPEDRKGTVIEWMGIKYKSIRELERKLLLPKGRVSWRLSKGYSLEDAIKKDVRNLHNK